MLSINSNRAVGKRPKYRYFNAIACFLLLQCVNASAMEFAQAIPEKDSNCRLNCKFWVKANGLITTESALQFSKLVGDSKRPITVFLNSAGGSVLGAMALGRAFRIASVSVVVASLVDNGERSSQIAAQCLSACVYALLGGTQRRLINGSIVGAHRMASVTRQGPFGLFQKRVYDDGSLRVILEEYVKEMGASLDLVDVAEHPGADAIYYLTPDELAKWRIETSVK